MCHKDGLCVKILICRNILFPMTRRLCEYILIFCSLLLMHSTAVVPTTMVRAEADPVEEQVEPFAKSVLEYRRRESHSRDASAYHLSKPPAIPHHTGHHGEVPPALPTGHQYANGLPAPLVC